ncbi:MAG TPA: VanZ family protein [Bacteroidia bacterium]|nr:VanZ family protein [Bacteroidia bacterium]
MFSYVYRYASGFLVVWTLLIFVLCAAPGRYIPSNSWLELLSLDKLVHASIFFILGALLLLRVYKLQQKAHWVFVYLIAAVSYGILLEVMQARFFSQRSYDPWDMMANSAGCLLALIFRGKLHKRFMTWAE